MLLLVVIQFIITARVRSTTGGYVFSLFTFRGVPRDGVPPARSGWVPPPNQVRMRYPWSGQVGQVGVPLARDGVPLVRDQVPPGQGSGTPGHGWVPPPRDRICLDRLCRRRYISYVRFPAGGLSCSFIVSFLL